jgi:hypothetical protein
VKSREAGGRLFDLRPPASCSKRKEVKIVTNVLAETKVRGGDGTSTISPEEITKHFANGYREIEVLPDGRVREITRDGDASEEMGIRTLKTERTWY